MSIVSSEEDIRVKALVCELCRQFYSLGWVTGTGGSISIKSKERKIFMSPSSVQKERMQPDDIYVLDELGEVIKPGVNPDLVLKLSQCHPLFMAAYIHRNAGAVIHTHSIHAVMIGFLFGSEFRASHLEMIKGVAGLEYTSEMVIPIIENTSQERDLLDSLQNAILKYPKSNAVIVRRHGIYVWGADWQQAKTQCECIDYLMQVCVQMKSLGIPTSLVNNPVNTLSSRIKSDISTVIFDIEGTLCPIDFVHNTLFGYIRNNLEEYTKRTWNEVLTIADRKNIIAQSLSDVNESGFVPIIDDDIPSFLSHIIWLMSKDSKKSSLKAFQGRILQRGFNEDGLLSLLYADVKPIFQSYIRKGCKIGIYSSGSVDLQKLVFSHVKSGLLTGHGDDLVEISSGCENYMPYLSFFFDAETAGSKRESKSYENIVRSLNVSANTCLFVTDIYEEALAASQIGINVAVIFRDGNKPISNCKFPVYRSLVDIPVNIPEEVCCVPKQS